MGKEDTTVATLSHKKLKATENRRVLLSAGGTQNSVCPIEFHCLRTGIFFRPKDLQDLNLQII